MADGGPEKKKWKVNNNNKWKIEVKILSPWLVWVECGRIHHL